MTNGVSLSGLSTELKTGLAFLTRLPVRSQPATGEAFVRASWTFPVIGAGVGAFGALVYWLAHALGLQCFHLRGPRRHGDTAADRRPA